MVENPADEEGPKKSNSPAFASGRRKHQSYQSSAGGYGGFLGTPDTVGPGAYDVHSALVKPKTPAIGFGSGRRAHHHYQTTSAPSEVGPGSYESPRLRSPSPGYVGMGSLAARVVPTIETSTPHDVGPGAYETTLSHRKSTSPGRGFGFSPSGRLARLEASDSPGPGSYESPRHVKPSPAYIGMGGLAASAVPTHDGSTPDVVGPGAYEGDSSLAKSKSSSAGFGSGRSAHQHYQSSECAARTEVGPGSYESPRCFKTPSFLNGMARSTPASVVPTDDGSTPDVVGPGAYEGDSSLVKSKSSSAGFGTGRSAHHHFQSSECAARTEVGPGSYDSPRCFKPPSFLNGMARSTPASVVPTHDGSTPDVVGPGAYEGDSSLVKSKASSAPVGFGTGRIEHHHWATKPKHTRSSKLGPGTYGHSRELQPSAAYVGMGSGPASEVPDTAADTPEGVGPGSYQIRSSFVRPKSPSASFGSGRHAHGSYQKAR